MMGILRWSVAAGFLVVAVGGVPAVAQAQPAPVQAPVTVARDANLQRVEPLSIRKAVASEAARLAQKAAASPRVPGTFRGAGNLELGGSAVELIGLVLGLVAETAVPSVRVSSTGRSTTLEACSTCPQYRVR